MPDKISGLFIPHGKDVPHTVAKWVADMNDADQAHFFNSLASHAKYYRKPACFQWAQMSGYLDNMGRRLLEELAECASDARPVSEVDAGEEG